MMKLIDNNKDDDKEILRQQPVKVPPANIHDDDETDR